MPISEELANLHTLKERGVITPDEFAQAKAHLLAQPPSGTARDPQRLDPINPQHAPPATRTQSRRITTRKTIALLSAATIALLLAAGGGVHLAQERAERARVEELKESMMNSRPAWQEITEELCSEIPNLCGNW